jgi:hypothetical protein
MSLLKYTMPANLPCYTGWDFPVYPGTFLFYMNAMINTFRQRIANDSKYVHMWSSKSGIRKEHFDCIDVLRWLEGHVGQDDDVVEWDNAVRDLFWSMSQPLVYGGRYRDVFCPVCSESYTPDKMRQIQWTFGEDLAAEGGHRLACPNGHTLYSIMEWNS